MKLDRHQWSLIGLIVSALIFTRYLSVHAQQSAKIARIGFLSSSGSAPSDVFRQALRNLGYIEGKNAIFEFRATEGTSERSAYFAGDLVRLKVDVIVAGGACNIRAAKNATSSIPIVMSGVNDPIALGLLRVSRIPAATSQVYQISRLS